MPPGAGANSVFVCPSSDGSIPSSDDLAGGVGSQDGYLLVWGAPPGGKGFGRVQLPTNISYVINSQFNSSAGHESQKVSQLRPAQSVVAFMEKRMVPGELPANSALYGKGLAQLKGEWKRFTTRHRQGGFLGFFDGHVAWFSQAELSTPTTFTPLDYNNRERAIWNPFDIEN